MSTIAAIIALCWAFTGDFSWASEHEVHVAFVWMGIAWLIHPTTTVKGDPIS